MKQFISIVFLLIIASLSGCSSSISIPDDQELVEIIQQAPLDKEINIHGPNALDPPVLVNSFETLEIISVHDTREFDIFQVPMIQNLMELHLFLALSDNKKFQSLFVNVMATGTVQSEVGNKDLKLKFNIPEERSLKYPTSLWFGLSKIKKGDKWNISLIGYEK